MSTATITSKGQITIPKQIRDSLMLHTGDRIDFTVTESGDVLLKPLTRRVDDLFGRLQKPGQQALTTEARTQPSGSAWVQGKDESGQYECTGALSGQ